jgi:hypothetical protein
MLTPDDLAALDGCAASVNMVEPDRLDGGVCGLLSEEDDPPVDEHAEAEAQAQRAFAHELPGRVAKPAGGAPVACTSGSCTCAYRKTSLQS